MHFNRSRQSNALRLTGMRPIITENEWNCESVKVSASRSSIEVGKGVWLRNQLIDEMGGCKFIVSGLEW